MTYKQVMVSNTIKDYKSGHNWPRRQTEWIQGQPYSYITKSLKRLNEDLKSQYIEIYIVNEQKLYSLLKLCVVKITNLKDYEQSYETRDDESWYVKSST